NQAARFGARRHASPYVDTRNHFDAETHFLAKSLEKRYIPCLARSEAKVLADKDTGCRNAVNEHFANKLLGRQSSEFLIERQDDYLLDAFLPHKLPALLRCIQKLGGAVRGDHLGRMR